MITQPGIINCVQCGADVPRKGKPRKFCSQGCFREWRKIHGQDGYFKPGVTPANLLYDWDKWFDGIEHNLIPGVDFKCKRNTFQVQVHAAARKRGLTCETCFFNGRVLLIVRGVGNARESRNQVDCSGASKAD